MADNPKYRETPVIARAEAEVALASNDKETICYALVDIAMDGTHDQAWVESTCIRFTQHDDAWIRGLAATCLGHSARVHGASSARAIEVLKALRTDPEVAGQAKDALDDVEIFAPESLAGRSE